MIVKTPIAHPRYFSLAAFERAGAGAYASWRRTIAGLFDVAAGPLEIGTFEGDHAAWSTGRFILSEATSSRVYLLRPPDVVAHSRLDHVAIRHIVCGSTAGLAGSTDMEVEAGDTFFIDLSQSLNVLISGRGRVTSDVTLWIPRQRWLASFRDENELHGLVVRGETPAGAVVGGSLRALAANARRMTVKEMDALANGVIELSARAAAHTLEVKTGSRTATVPVASFVSIRRFIDRNLTSRDLCTDMIATKFGLSRASLYRLFEPVGGVAGYVRKRRLERAYQEITAPSLANQRIGPIAYRLGFSNVSAFNRVFRSAFGMSPSEARGAALAGIPSFPSASEAEGDDCLGRWLTELKDPGDLH